MRKFIIAIISILSIICVSCQKQTNDSQRDYKKVWLHRANTIEKAQYFQDKYAGLEIDITYLDSLHTFIVFHGGGLSEAEPVRLEQWFEEVGNANKLKLWLDFKNLSNNNKMQALTELNRLCKKYNISKNNIIVENWNAKDLSAFQENGYQISYYIPDFNPQKASKFDIQKHTYKIRKAISSYNITTISGYHYQYQFMRDSFPDQNVLIWYINNDKKVQEEYIQLANQDDKVKVLLIADEIPENEK